MFFVAQFSLAPILHKEHVKHLQYVMSYNSYSKNYKDATQVFKCVLFSMKVMYLSASPTNSNCNNPFLH